MEQENNITTYNNSSEISAVADNIPEFHNSTIDPIWNDDATFFGQRMSREEYEKRSSPDIRTRYPGIEIIFPVQK